MIHKSARAAKGVVSLWSTDSSTFPVVFLVGIAATAAIGNGIRHLLNNPDVCLTKSTRNNSMHYDNEKGAEWSARRSQFATIRKNPINQSAQFEEGAKNSEQ